MTKKKTHQHAPPSPVRIMLFRVVCTSASRTSSITMSFGCRYALTGLPLLIFQSKFTTKHRERFLYRLILPGPIWVITAVPLSSTARGNENKNQHSGALGHVTSCHVMLCSVVVSTGTRTISRSRSLFGCALKLRFLCNRLHIAPFLVPIPCDTPRVRCERGNRDRAQLYAINMCLPKLCLRTRTLRHFAVLSCCAIRICYSRLCCLVLC